MTGEIEQVICLLPQMERMIISLTPRRIDGEPFSGCRRRLFLTNAIECYFCQYRGLLQQSGELHIDGNIYCFPASAPSDSTNGT